MQMCLVIHGFPAVGKTSVCRQLVHVIGKKLSLGIIQGDFFAHMIYGCTYTEMEIELKYRNMYRIMDNLFSFGRSVIVDDFFKREADISSFLTHMSAWDGVHQIYIHLCADKEVRLERNRVRDYWDWIPETRLINFMENDFNFPDEFVLDNSAKIADDTVEDILTFLVSQGIYDSDLPDVVPEFFKPIQDPRPE